VNSYSLAERINSKVNASVTYKSDLEQYSKPEFWKEAGAFGDCEDYALLKRHRLIEAGFARKDLHLACCWDETGAYHCVLLELLDGNPVFRRSVCSANLYRLSKIYSVLRYGH